MGAKDRDFLLKPQNTPLRVLMCPPAYFSIPTPKENARMVEGVKPDSYISWKQWMAVRNIYAMFGMHVIEIPPEPDLMSMVFTANGAWGLKRDDIQRSECVLSNFKNETRVHEKRHYAEWMEILGITAYELPEYVKFEGQGDVITLSDTYLFGSGIRSSPEARELVQELLHLNRPITPLNLINPLYYHLDTCCMSLRGTYKEAVVFYPGAFDEESVERLRSLNKVEKYEVSDNLANMLICNSVFLDGILLLNMSFPCSMQSFKMSASGQPLMRGGKRYIEMGERNSEYHALTDFLWDLGYKIIPVYTSEYNRTHGAGVRCMTLFLD